MTAGLLRDEPGGRVDAAMHLSPSPAIETRMLRPGKAGPCVERGDDGISPVSDRHARSGLPGAGARIAGMLGRIGRSLLAGLRGETYRGQRCFALLFATDADRGAVIGDRRFAQILDSYWVLEGAGREALTVAPIGSHYTGRRAYGKVIAPSLPDTLGDLAAAAMDRLSGGRRGWRARAERNYYRRLLVATGCEVVIGIQPPDALIDLCRERNCPVHELQHGVISSEIPYYDRLGSAPNLAYLVWDETSRDTLVADLSVGEERIKVVGNPWLRLYREPPPAFRDQFRSERERAKAAVSTDRDMPVVLVTLQWGIQELYPEEFDSPYFPSALGEAIRARPDVLWWLRPHPMMVDGHGQGWQQISGQLAADANVRLCHPHEISLPVALDLAQGHVTWHSSSVIEASLTGVPSLVLCTSSYVHKDASGAGYAAPDAKLPYAEYRAGGLISWAGEAANGKRDDILRFVDRLTEDRA